MKIRALSIGLAALLLAAPALAGPESRGEIQAPRTQDEIQAPVRADEIQAPVREDGIQAPRSAQAV